MVEFVCRFYRHLWWFPPQVFTFFQWPCPWPFLKTGYSFPPKQRFSRTFYLISFIFFYLCFFSNSFFVCNRPTRRRWVPVLQIQHIFFPMCKKNLMLSILETLFFWQLFQFLFLKNLENIFPPCKEGWTSRKGKLHHTRVYLLDNQSSIVSH